MAPLSYLDFAALLAFVLSKTLGYNPPSALQTVESAANAALLGGTAKLANEVLGTTEALVRGLQSDSSRPVAATLLATFWDLRPDAENYILFRWYG
ncbi:hypothetical protein L596_013802 [Steinernema carpocapsae]|uniref:Uncharacterized protein n=1 Tax=Steinernema carpocapsae TaxID=34508 RepID=A0A4V6A574_STECR|nr:hypothetical protein L596_013802 [Steinernema carpocapsae]